MKKRTVIMSLVLSLAMILGTFSTVFAATGPATEATKQAIDASGIRCTIKITDELSGENMAIKFAEDVAIGKYGLANTDEVKALKEQGAVILDTMPDTEKTPWFSGRHIPGAINAQAGDRWTEDEKGSFEVFSAEQRTALYDKVKAAVGTKQVTKYKNKKTKKLISTTAYKKLSKKNKKKYTKVKVNVINKDKPVVVYCGFVGCRRSHQAARFLVTKGLKNVYRYPGGITAWVDGGNDIEGTDVAE